jgi:hypothetical protein
MLAVAWTYACRVVGRFRAMLAAPQPVPASALTMRDSDEDVAMCSGKNDRHDAWKCKRCTLWNPNSSAVCVGCHRVRTHFPIFKVRGGSVVSSPSSNVVLLWVAMFKDGRSSFLTIAQGMRCKVWLSTVLLPPLADIVRSARTHFLSPFGVH